MPSQKGTSRKPKAIITGPSGRYLFLAIIPVVALAIIGLSVLVKRKPSIIQATRTSIACPTFPNVPDSAIPNNQYLVVYVDDGKQAPVACEIVSDISLNEHAMGVADAIARETLSAYWYGYVDYGKRIEKSLAIRQSWSNTEVLVDGKSIFKGDMTSGQAVKHQFRRGRNKVEVRYHNNYHTSNFALRFIEPRQIFSLAETKAALEKYSPGKTSYWFAAVYESSAFGHTITLHPFHTDKPAVLVLSSYEPVTWDLVNFSKVAAVVVDSHEAETTEVVNVSKRVPVIYIEPTGNYVFEKPPTDQARWAHDLIAPATFDGMQASYSPKDLSF